MKRTLSLLLALTLALALAVPAMAADYGEFWTVGYKFDAVRKDAKTILLAKNEGDNSMFQERSVVLITAAPGSTFQSENGQPLSARAYYKTEDGKYFIWEGKTFEIAAGKPLDNLFKQAADNDKTWAPKDPRAYIFVFGSDNSGADYCLALGTESATQLKLNIVPSPQKLTVNGNEKKTEIYNIDGSNYFKLRDIAALLNGTKAQFDITFNQENNTIVVTSNRAYEHQNGTELKTGVDNSASAVKSSQSVWINGKAVELAAYNIGGSNFFKLRDLGDALNFKVGYEAETNTATISSFVK